MEGENALHIKTMLGVEKMSFTVAKHYDSLQDFEPWSGAKSIYERIMDDEEACEYIEDYLEQVCDCCDWSETTINDFLWFDAEEILVDVGIWEYE